MSEHSWVLMAFYGLIIAIALSGIILAAVVSTLHIDLGFLGFILGNFWVILVIIILVLFCIVLLILRMNSS